MAERKKASTKSSAAKAPAAKQPAAKQPAVVAASASAWPDGYEGIDWELYERVRPHEAHTGASGAGLVEYTLWLEVIGTRPPGNRIDIPLPGQPI
mgnify:CR=1 FL=1